MSDPTTFDQDSSVTGDVVATGHSAGENHLHYLNTLRKLGNLGAAINSALIEAHTADTGQQRRIALTTLHSRLRDMAATANDALGNWAEPDDPPLQADNA